MAAKASRPSSISPPVSSTKTRTQNESGEGSFARTIKVLTEKLSSATRQLEEEVRLKEKGQEREQRRSLSVQEVIDQVRLIEALACALKAMRDLTSSASSRGR